MTLVSEARFLVGTRILLLRKFLKACFLSSSIFNAGFFLASPVVVVLEELKFLRITRIGIACAPVWVRWRRTSTHPHTHQDNTGGMVRFGAMIRPSSCTYATAQVTSWLTPGHTVLRGPLSLAPFGSLATNRAPPNERTGS